MKTIQTPKQVNNKLSPLTIKAFWNFTDHHHMNNQYRPKTRNTILTQKILPWETLGFLQLPHSRQRLNIHLSFGPRLRITAGAKKNSKRSHESENPGVGQINPPFLNFQKQPSWWDLVCFRVEPLMHRFLIPKSLVKRNTNDQNMTSALGNRRNKSYKCWRLKTEPARTTRLSNSLWRLLLWRFGSSHSIIYIAPFYT